MTDEEQISRDKPMSEMSPQDWVDFQRTGQRPKSDAYRQAKAKALADAGLKDDTPGPARTRPR